MAITKVINDAVDLNQASDYSGLRLPVGTTGNVIESFTTDYLVVAGGGAGGGLYRGGGGGAGGLRTSYNNSTTTTNTLSFPSGKTAIATYMLDGNATDISGNYNGTESNISYNTGQYGGAAVFNGSSSYINTNYTLTTDTTFSFSWWMNAELPSSGNNFIVNDGNGIVHDGTFAIYINASNQLGMWIGNNSSVTSGTLSITGGVTGSWMHFAVSVDGPTATVYKNGSSAGTISLTSHTTAGILTLIIGRLGHYSGNYLNGSIDQVRIYDSALSSSDVSNIYTNEVQALSGGGSAAESSLTLAEGVAYDVTVGGGGIGVFNNAGGDGGISVFSNITSDGGGGGSEYSANSGRNGGSGGGSAGYSSTTGSGGNGTVGQGYAGGQGNAGGPQCGGGGGGASATGEPGGSGATDGDGGDGIITNILNSTNAALASVGEVLGSNVYYSGGAGGGNYGTGNITIAGKGGGAAGASGSSPYTSGPAATNNTGGAGGGGNGETAPAGSGGNGGSGVVILRYSTASVSSFTTTGTLNTPSTTDTVANVAYPVTNTAYYKLDGNATDSSSNGYNGSASNVTWQNGRFSQAAVFNGTNSSISTPITSSDIGTSFTISCWVNVDAASDNYHVPIGNYSLSGGWYMAMFNNMKFNFYSSVGSIDFSTTATYEYGNWYHFCVVFTHNSDLKVFINGNKETNSQSVAAGTSTAGIQIGVIGSYSSSTNTEFDGKIDQVRIFSSALSDSQVTELYNEHYQTQFTEGSDTAILFTEGTGTVTFSGVNPAPPQGALRTNTSYSEDGSGSVIEHYNGTDWKRFDATKYCTTNTLNFPSGAGCVASYNLNNNVNDIGNTYNGVNSNVTFNASGKFGAAAVFNGSSSIISIPQPTLSGGFTLSAWFKTTSSAFQSIITMGGSSAAAGLNIFTNSGNVITSFGNGSSEDYNAPTSSVTVNTGAWFHVALSTSGLSSGSTVKLYINGQLDDSESSSTSINTTSYTSAFSIGGRNLSGSLSTYFNGDIDQVRIFNDSLTSDEVSKLYNNEIACS